MTESGGDVLVTDNAPADAAIEMFSELEGVDIEPAAGVALACLRAAAADGRIPGRRGCCSTSPEGDGTSWNETTCSSRRSPTCTCPRKRWPFRRA